MKAKARYVRYVRGEGRYQAAYDEMRAQAMFKTVPPCARMDAFRTWVKAREDPCAVTATEAEGLVAYLADTGWPGQHMHAEHAALQRVVRTFVTGGDLLARPHLTALVACYDAVMDEVCGQSLAARTTAAVTIQRAFFTCYYTPWYVMCRRRLAREFDELRRALLLPLPLS